MKREFTYPSRNGTTQIHAIEWKPEGEVRAVLQICHGMVEFIDRYDEFARFMNMCGYYVAGHDHLGHGASVIREEDYGYFHMPRGNECVVGDIHKLRCMTQRKYPDVPYFMLGHSMGSFLLRQYIVLHGRGLSGAVIMGTGSQPAAVLAGGRMICRIIAAFRGWRHRSSLVDNMAFGSYNKRFEPGRTGMEWLTRDEECVENYVTDPWCTFRFTVNGYYQMFRGIQFAQKRANIRRIPKDLPLFIVAGADDPVGNFGKGVEKAARVYRENGIKNIKLRLYENDRHEILNELDRQNIYEDLYLWMEENSEQH